MRWLAVLLLWCAPLAAHTPSELEALYNSLDPTSITQHLAFYDLYSNTPAGQKALATAWSLLARGQPCKPLPIAFPNSISSLLALIQPLPSPADSSPLSDDALQLLEEVAATLPNRSLKGYSATNEQELLDLPSDQVDLAHGLCVLTLGDSPEAQRKTRVYEATLDLMALQVLARAPLTASPARKIEEINRLIFYEMGFRFPPQSIYAEQVDRFSFLPSVLESRRGVCLGVVLLYYAVAQRVALPLEIYTPPGHIFLSFNGPEGRTNIETTARGIHLPFDEYLGVNTVKLPPRTPKEALGMSFFNQASIFLHEGAFDKAATCYERAVVFEDEPFVKELLGCCYILLGKDSEGRKLLTEAAAMPIEGCISRDMMAGDLLERRVGPDGLRPLFLYVNDRRETIERKLAALEEACERYPHFRSGFFHRAVCLLQLQRLADAVAVLEELEKVGGEKDVTVEYYLAALSHARFDAPGAWRHLELAKKIAKGAGAQELESGRVLRELEVELGMVSRRST